MIHMKKRTNVNRQPFLVGAFAAVSALTVAAVPALAFTGQQYEAQAKVSLPQAEAAVAKAVPGGRITDRELEKEKGGSGLRYSFDVKVHGKTREIGVDAKTGKVLENSVEGANAD
ncbi:hypothetical protein GCM10008024_38860 [Allgaiera indica]|nr:hypothetical protein GCM10008024_38860 [Allgaiera indica]